MTLRRIITILTIICAVVAATDTDAARRKRSKTKKSTPARTEQTTASTRFRNSSEVKREQQRNEQAIADTRRQISQNDKETSRQLNRLNLINARINQRADTIRGLSRQLDEVNGNIASLDDTISALNLRGQALRKGYAESLRQSRTRRQSIDYLSFIFSAKTFDQAWRRVRYLRELSKTSARQAEQIKVTTARLQGAKQRLDTLRTERSTSLASLNRVQQGQKREQADQGRIVADLRKQGKSLNRELERRRQQAAALDRELNRIVEQEIRQAEARRQAEEKARREAQEKARREAAARAQQQKAQQEAADAKEAKTAKETKKTEDPKKTARPVEKPVAEKPAEKPAEKTPTPEKPVAEKKPAAFDSQAEADRRLTGSFESNKGRLLFPVAGRYTVVSQFGTYDHPDLEKVKVNNLGIDVEVPRGSSVRSVFEGVVSSIFRLDGYNTVVIVRHGEYLTVYGGIDRLAVKKGDNVRTGQNLGTLYSDPDDGGRTRLHFEIRHEKSKLNPSEWVR